MAVPLRTLVDGTASTLTRPRVVIVGLGQAATLTVDALAGVRSVQIVGGVDPLTRNARVSLPAAIPVFGSLADVSPSLEFDVVVVATPTPTHIDVCIAVLEQLGSGQRILCEKPLATSYGLVRMALDRAASTGVPLDVLYHYAFAPEVAWLAERRPEIEAEHGFIARTSSRFDDPKASLTSASTTLTSSWADSGINALSVLARFVNLARISSASKGAPALCHAIVEYESGGHQGEGSVTTSWTAPEVLKETALILADGTSFTMNHAKGTVSTTDRQGGRVVYQADRDIPLPRDRYRRMLAAYLAGDSRVFDGALTLRLHELLAQGFESNA
jgi:predicted dehydrogenase